MLQALVPAYLELDPSTPGLVSYGETGTRPDLADVGFFVPAYMNEEPTLHWAAHMPALEVLQLPTAGFEHARSLRRPGLVVCNAAGVHDDSTAELAIGLILASQRGIDVAARDMTTGTWAHRTYPSLADRSVVIVGAGRIAKAIAARLAAFACTVTLVGRQARGRVRGVDDLDALAAQADILVLAVPGDASTHHLVDARLLGLLPHGALVVNVARGSVVDTEALLVALQEGRVRAALDVTDPEPLPSDHPLWHAPGCLVTPHLGGNTTAFVPRARALVLSQIERWRLHEPFANIIWMD